MHDETFLVTKGTVRFTVPEAPGLEGKIIDAKTGDYVVVPTRAPHTFSNETDEEARFVNTFTPVSSTLPYILGRDCDLLLFKYNMAS
jgi:quercetin dioxygenase-like cupin family protein